METTEKLTEVMAQVLSYDQFKTLLTTKQKADFQTKLAEILADPSLEPLAKFNKAKSLEEQANSHISEVIGGLTRYMFYTDGTNQYLIESQPIKQAKTVNATQLGEKSFTIPFQSGDLIRLEHDGKVSQTYTYTLAGLLDEVGQPIKASKAVEQFMFDILGKVRLPNFKGFPGLSHPYWKVVELDTLLTEAEAIKQQVEAEATSEQPAEQNQ